MAAVEAPSKRAVQGSRARIIALIGPAFVASIAYVDPGNVAANVSSGAEFGYLLVWVLVLANVMAALVQYLSAKLALVTGRNLPELVGERLPRTGRLLFWAQAELIAAATDLAEVIGGAIALQLLFHLPLLLGGLIVGVVSVVLLAVQSRHGERTFEYVTMGLLLIITVGFVAGLFVSPVNWAQAAHGLLPRFDGSQSVLLAASMVGATVMPHAIYLHSSLSRERHGTTEDPVRIRRLLRVNKWDVGSAMLVAGAVNVAMLLLAAASLPGVAGADTIAGAHDAIVDSLGPAIGVIFAIGLLASGLASTSVGAAAGASVMQGLLRIQVPMLVRRILTLIPALVVLGIGVDPTWALVLSQVFLSIGIPFALIPLAWFTSHRRFMGGFANGTVMRITVTVVAAAIIVLNVLLLVLVFAGQG
jgi:manganese transport protein